MQSETKSKWHTHAKKSTYSNSNMQMGEAHKNKQTEFIFSVSRMFDNCSAYMHTLNRSTFLIQYNTENWQRNY